MHIPLFGLKKMRELKIEDILKYRIYLIAYNFDIGLLINFGRTKLEFKRLFRIPFFCC